jgi:cold shock CspA family protein
MSNRRSGHCVRFDRGFGFIALDDERKDIFVHVSPCPYRAALQPGDRVTFNIEHDDRGRARAVDVAFATPASEKLDPKVIRYGAVHGGRHEERQ